MTKSKLPLYGFLGKVAKLPLALIWIFRFVFFLFIIFFLLGVAAFFMESCDLKPPSVKEAPWKIQTYSYDNDQRLLSRVYYAKDYVLIEGEPSIINYWEFDGKHYNYKKETKLFRKSIYGSVDVIRRK